MEDSAFNDRTQPGGSPNAFELTARVNDRGKVHEGADIPNYHQSQSGGSGTCLQNKNELCSASLAPFSLADTFLVFPFLELGSPRGTLAWHYRAPVSEEK